MKTDKPRTNRKFVIIAGALCIFLLVAACYASPGTSFSSSSSSSSISISSAQIQKSESTLFFTVDADSWDSTTDGGLFVRIDGTDENGASVGEQYRAVPGIKYKTDLKPGSYALALASASPEKGTRLFRAEQAQFEFSGDTDKSIVLSVKLDEEAVAAAEASRKAAEEKAAAEKAAKEAAAAQSAPKAPETNSATNNASEMTVYVASSGKGKKYHSNPNCSRMKGTISLTVSQAQAKGYGPCSKCM